MAALILPIVLSLSKILQREEQAKAGLFMTTLIMKVTYLKEEEMLSQQLFLKMPM